MHYVLDSDECAKAYSIGLMMKPFGTLRTRKALERKGFVHSLLFKLLLVVGVFFQDYFIASVPEVILETSRAMCD